MAARPWRRVRGWTVLAVALALTVVGALVAALSWETVYRALGLPYCSLGSPGSPLDLTMPCEPWSGLVVGGTTLVAVVGPLLLGAVAGWLTDRYADDGDAPPPG